MRLQTALALAAPAVAVAVAAHATPGLGGLRAGTSAAALAQPAVQVRASLVDDHQFGFSRWLGEDRNAHGGRANNPDGQRRLVTSDGVFAAKERQVGDPAATVSNKAKDSDGGLAANQAGREEFIAAEVATAAVIDKEAKSGTVKLLDSIKNAFSLIPYDPPASIAMLSPTVGASIFAFGFVSIFFMWITHCCHCCSCGQNICRCCRCCFCSAKCGKIFCAFMLFLAAIVLAGGFNGRNMFQAAAATTAEALNELSASFQALNDGAAELTVHKEWYATQLGKSSVGTAPTDPGSGTDAQWVADATAGKMYCDVTPSSPAVKHAAGDCDGDATGSTCYSDERVWGFHSNAQVCSGYAGPVATACYDGAAELQLEVMKIFATALGDVSGSLPDLLSNAATMMSNDVTPYIDKGLGAMVGIIWILVFISVIAVFTQCKADDAILLCFGTIILIVVLVAICFELTFAVIISDICNEGPDVAIPRMLEEYAGVGGNTTAQLKYVIDCGKAGGLSPLEPAFINVWETVMVFDIATDRHYDSGSGNTNDNYVTNGKTYFQADSDGSTAEATTTWVTSPADEYADPNLRNRGDCSGVHGCNRKACDEVHAKTDAVVATLFKIWSNYACPPANKAWVKLMYEVTCKNLLGGMAQIAAVQFASWLMIMMVFFMMPCANAKGGSEKVGADDDDSDDGGDDHVMEDD